MGRELHHVGGMEEAHCMKAHRYGANAADLAFHCSIWNERRTVKSSQMGTMSIGANDIVFSPGWISRVVMKKRGLGMAIADLIEVEKTTVRVRFFIWVGWAPVVRVLMRDEGVLYLQPKIWRRGALYEALLKAMGRTTRDHTPSIDPPAM